MDESNDGESTTPSDCGNISQVRSRKPNKGLDKGANSVSNAGDGHEPNEAVSNVESVENKTLQHETSDPVPPSSQATRDEWTVYRAELDAHVLGWCQMQKEASFSPADAIWSDFTCDFSRTGIGNLNPTQANKIREVLLERGVFVLCKRGYPKKKALVDCWEQSDCPTTQGNELRDSNGNRESDAVFEAAELAVGAAEAVKSISNAVEAQSLLLKDAKQNTENLHDDVHDEGNERTDYRGKEVHMNRTPQRSSGLQGLLKAFGSRRKYCGLWDEDLVGVIEVFELAAEMCSLTPDEMLKGLSVMLDGDALSYYGAHVRGHCDTYQEAITKLLSWFTSDEQRARLLQEWHEMRLTAWFRKSKGKSQLSVFRDMSARLSKVQRQLDTKYREDVFLRDQLMIAADVPEVKKALRIHVPATAHDANQKIASLLSSELNSAETYCEKDDEVFFGLGQRYKGDAERRFGGFSNSQKRFHRNPNRKRLAKVKGCWVCGKNHLANKFHSRDEVEKALAKLKGNGAYVLAGDVFDVLVAEEGESSTSESGSIVIEDENCGMLAVEVSDLNTELEVNLSNNAFIHSCGFFTERRNDIQKMNAALAVNERKSEFNGMIIDTGANRLSIMSLQQYRAYCREHGVPSSISKDRRRISGLGSKHYSIGTATISIPFPSIGLICDVNFHIFEDNVQTLLSRRDLKSTGIDLSVQRDCLHFMGKEQKLIVENDFLFYRWAPEHALFTYGELTKLHRAFGHPSVSALNNVLRRARPAECSNTVKDAIEFLTDRCKVCSELASKPKRFKLTIGTEDARFNSVVAVDIMYLHGKPVLHAVDEATHFAAAKFLRKVSSKEVWKSLLQCWNYVYLGPPDHLRVDQGSQFTSKEFKEYTEASGIMLLQEPVENPSSMSHVERYHAPLRCAYEKLEKTLPTESRSDLLQLAVHCVNSTVGPEGLCPTLCVFGAMPKPIRNIPAPQQLARAEAIDAVMDAVAKEQAKRRVSFGLKYRGPFGKERIDLDSLQFGALVRVYRETSKRWEGPFKFIWKDGETVCVQMPYGRQIFRSHVVKEDKSVNSMDETSGPHGRSNEVDSKVLCAMFQDPLVFSATTDESHTFEESRMAEIRGLQEARVFEIVPSSSVPKGTRIFGTRWIDTVKKGSDGAEIEKSRLVAQNYRDFQSKQVPTKAPTISKFGERLALCIAAMQPDNRPYVRDVTQAYIQSKSGLERKVYLRPPSEMELADGMILLAKKPLYGIPESGLHWFITYRDHHVGKLRMKTSKTDHCILYRRTPSDTGIRIPAITILQVDDSFGVGNEQFLAEEETYSHVFKTKPRKCLEPGDSCDFNGATITRCKNRSYTLTQEEKMSTLRPATTDEGAISLRAKIQYVATTCRPDIASYIQLLTFEVNQRTSSSKEKLKSAVEYCKSSSEIGLKYVQLDVESLRLVLFTDSSFGNAADLSSQMGFVVTLMDSSGSANILHYGSKKCRRVTRSVMAAELLALVHGYDEAFMVRHTLLEIMGIEVPLDAYVDSRTTFNCVAKNASTIEKRLQIDVAALREAHMRKELRTVGWIPGTKNPADGLTKSTILKANHPLVELMKTNRLDIQATGWAEMN